LGLFIGPVVFSLGYRLLISWMEEAKTPDSSMAMELNEAAMPNGDLEE
jgi:hypothetical protein